MQQSMLPLETLSVLGPHNFDLYRNWFARAVQEPQVRRFLSSNGWIEQIKEPPTGDWGMIALLRGPTLIVFSFDRSPEMEISLACWTLGPHKELKTGRAMAEALPYLTRYSYFRRIRSGCMGTNRASLRLHRHLFGKPWGIEPQCSWDEVSGRFVDLHRFSLPLKEFLKRNVRRKK